MGRLGTAVDFVHQVQVACGQVGPMWRGRPRALSPRSPRAYQDEPADMCITAAEIPSA
jgi:hypothetical protein